MQDLKQLAKDCNFKSVTANQDKEEAIREAFINGLQSNLTRQSLLENKALELQTAYDQAGALDIAQKSSATYSQFATPIAATNLSVSTSKRLDSQRQTDYSAATKPSCYFCRNSIHPRRNCPTRDVQCHKCSKKGHFAKVCQTTTTAAVVSIHTSEGNTRHTSGNHTPSLATAMAVSTNSPFKVSTQVLINGHPANALLDSGSTDKSFISDDFAKTLRSHRRSASGYVCMNDHFFIEIKNSGILFSQNEASR